MKIKKGFSVFLVDKGKRFLETLKAGLLIKFGKLMSVFEFGTGEACIQNMDTHPDIIVPDYYLHSAEHFDAADGIKTLKGMKSNFQNTAVIMLSGQDKMEVAADAVKYGAYNYIAKSESAFVCIQNAISNVLENISTTRKTVKYYKWNISFAAVLVLEVIMYLIWYSNAQ